MCFIYSLSHNNVIFYIGKSCNPHARYRLHIASAKHKKTDTAKKICEIIDSGEYPSLNILKYLNEDMAANMEIFLITSIHASGQKLTNQTCTTQPKPQTTPKLTSKKMAYKDAENKLHRKMIQYNIKNINK